MERSLRLKERKKALKAKVTPEYKAELASFEIEEVLGKGSFGVVWKARHISSGRVYALKSLDKQSVLQERLVAHTLLERDVLALLGEHEFIIDLHYAFQTKEKLFLAIDYVPGGSLWDQFRDRQQPLREAEARFYAAEIVLAMEAMHTQDFMYRDLKLENILLDEEGHIRLSDFGLAYKVKKLAKVKSFSGTPLYLAPEQLDDKGHGREIDFWAFGVFLHVLLTLKPPFWDEDINLLFNKIQRQRLDLSELNLSDEAKSLLNGLLTKPIATRLGHTGGWSAVKSHAFFEGVHWNDVYDKLLPPPLKPITMVQSGTLEDAEVSQMPSAGGEEGEEVEGNEQFKAWDFVSVRNKEELDSLVIHVEVRVHLHEVTGILFDDEETATLMSLGWEISRKGKVLNAGESKKIQCAREATCARWDAVEFLYVFQIPKAEFLARQHALGVDVTGVSCGTATVDREKEHGHEHSAQISLLRQGHATGSVTLAKVPLYLWDYMSVSVEDGGTEEKYVPFLTKTMEQVHSTPQHEIVPGNSGIELTYSVGITCKQKFLVSSGGAERQREKKSGGTIRNTLSRARSASTWVTGGSSTSPRSQSPRETRARAPSAVVEGSPSDLSQAKSTMARPQKKKKSKSRMSFYSLRKRSVESGGQEQKRRPGRPSNASTGDLRPVVPTKPQTLRSPQKALMEMAEGSGSDADDGQVGEEREEKKRKKRKKSAAGGVQDMEETALRRRKSLEKSERREKKRKQRSDADYESTAEEKEAKVKRKAAKAAKKDRELEQAKRDEESGGSDVGPLPPPKPPAAAMAPSGVAERPQRAATVASAAYAATPPPVAKKPMSLSVSKVPPKTSSSGKGSAAVPSLKMGDWRERAAPESSASARALIARQLSSRGIAASQEQAGQAPPPIPDRPARAKTVQVHQRQPITSLTAPMPKGASKEVLATVSMVERKAEAEEAEEKRVTREEAAHALPGPIKAQQERASPAAPRADIAWTSPRAVAVASAPAGAPPPPPIQDDEELEVESLLEEMNSLLEQAEIPAASVPPPGDATVVTAPQQREWEQDNPEALASSPAAQQEASASASGGTVSVKVRKANRRISAGPKAGPGLAQKVAVLAKPPKQLASGAYPDTTTAARGSGASGQPPLGAVSVKAKAPPAALGTVPSKQRPEKPPPPAKPAIPAKPAMPAKPAKPASPAMPPMPPMPQKPARPSGKYQS